MWHTDTDHYLDNSSHPLLTAVIQLTVSDLIIAIVEFWIRFMPFTNTVAKIHSNLVKLATGIFEHLNVIQVRTCLESYCYHKWNASAQCWGVKKVACCGFRGKRIISIFNIFNLNYVALSLGCRPII